MKRAALTLLTCLSLIGVNISVPALAADGGHYRGGGHGYDRPHARGYDRGYRNGFRKGGRYGWRDHHRFGRHDRFRHRGRWHGRRHFHRHGGRGLAYGLLGFGLGVVIADAANSRRRNEPDVIVVPAEQPRYQPAPQPSPSYRNDPFAGANCLQIREYQTTVIIGGVEREGYGPACLQQDGSWLQGPVSIAPY